jgi:hypothetical protein
MLMKLILRVLKEIASYNWKIEQEGEEKGGERRRRAEMLMEGVSNLILSAGYLCF